jgi:hypothetical protein
MDHTTTIALIGFSLIVGTYLLSRLIGAMRVNRPPSALIYGDVVELPAAAKNAGGGRQIHGDGLAQADVIARRHNGTAM